MSNYDIDHERVFSDGTLFFDFLIYSLNPEELNFIDFSVQLVAPDPEKFTDKAVDEVEHFLYNLIHKYMNTVNSNCEITSENCYYFINREVMENGLPYLEKRK